VKIVELNTTTTTQNSYFFFENIPVGSYTLTLDTTGASPATIPGVPILPTQFEDTTYIGTITLLAGDVNNDSNVNIIDWPTLADAWSISATATMTNWQEKFIEADFDHNDKVNINDGVIFRDNFGKQQQKGKAKRLAAIPAKAKKTSGRIELSFNLETLEGVDINELRVGNIIWLKINIRDAKGSLGGELHLSFDPKVLQVVNVPAPSAVISTPMIKSLSEESEEVRIQEGPYITGGKSWPLVNKVANKSGKIDYAVGFLEPKQEDEGLLAIVPFKIISCGVSSKVGFEFDEEENRQTMFIERTTTEQEPVDQLPEVDAKDITITVPLVYNDLMQVVVYPNPSYKGKEVTFDRLTSDKQVTLKIYNLAGELVYEKEGKNKITWNLKNKDGEEVASGIYIYFLRDENGSTKRGKIGVIK